MEDPERIVGRYSQHPTAKGGYIASSDNTVRNVITEPATSFHQRKEPKN